MPSAGVDKGNGKSEIRAERVPSHAGTLEELVGAHPEALRKIYGGGTAADPAQLGEAPHGRVLSFELGAEVFRLLLPLVRAMASDAFPWKGKVFDHGGNAGQNVVLGKPMIRFRTELGPSEIDGKPT